MDDFERLLLPRPNYRYACHARLLMVRPLLISDSEAPHGDVAVTDGPRHYPACEVVLTWVTNRWRRKLPELEEVECGLFAPDEGGATAVESHRYEFSDESELFGYVVHDGGGV